MRSTNELIAELTKSHTAVKRDYPPIVRTILTLYVLPTTLILTFYLMSPFSFSIKNMTHGLELIALLIFINAATFLGFKSFVPGETKKTTTMVVMFSAILLSLSLFSRTFVGQTFDIIRPFCELEAMAISMVTTLIGHFLLRKNEFAARGITSKAIFISMPLIATVFLHGVCSLQFGHVLICHLLAPTLIPILYLTFFNRKKM